jgi:hypothetical protein
VLLGVGLSLCKPDSISDRTVTEIQDDVATVILIASDSTLKSSQKLAKILPPLLKPVMPMLESPTGGALSTSQAVATDAIRVRQIFAIIIDCASGDFSGIPALLKMLGSPLPVEVEATAVQCLNLLNGLERTGMSASEMAKASATVVLQKLVDDLFDQIDSEKSGSISLYRFIALFHQLGLPLNDDEAKNLFAKLDTSGDGFLDRAEFQTAVRVIQEKVGSTVVSKLDLQPAQIAVRLAVLLTLLGFFLTFILMGSAVFSDGAVFTAVIAGIMPMSSKAFSFLSTGAELVIKKAEQTLNELF